MITLLSNIVDMESPDDSKWN